jgi:flagellar biogenesis protein FliO
VTGGPTDGVAQVFVYLIVLAGLLGGAFWFLRRGGTLFQPRSKGPRKLNISETRLLGSRQYLVVAEYEEQKVLLGVCPGRIDYLCRLGARPSEEEAFAVVLPEKAE